MCCTLKIWELVSGRLILSLFSLKPFLPSQSTQWTPQAFLHSCFPWAPLDRPPLVTSLAPTSLDPGRWGSGMPPASALSCFWNVTCPDRRASSTCPSSSLPPAMAFSRHTGCCGEATFRWFCCRLLSIQTRTHVDTNLFNNQRIVNGHTYINICGITRGPQLRSQTSHYQDKFHLIDLLHTDLIPHAEKIDSWLHLND